jgi:rod shape-determining protein MreC
VYDKTVRRRRAVLGLLVACSLILLTASFGDSAGGGVTSIQRGVLDVVSPIQEGASRALKPVRDLFGWVGDTVHAKGKVDDLEKERNDLRKQLVDRDAALRQNTQLRDLLALDTNAALKDNQPVTARVIGRSPTVWYSQLTVDKGSTAGIRIDQPVVTGAGLVGKVTTVTRGTAIVTLVTDAKMSVSARVNENGVPGVLQTRIGDPLELELKYTTREDTVKAGQRVVTSGTDTRVSAQPSLYPPDIPIGRVTRVDDEGTDDQVVHVKPFADMRRLEFVQVLTRRQDANRR